MSPHTRAMIAAATFAVITGKKVAGIYDHAAGQRLKIAAECRGDQLQGFDGDRGAKFGGTLPEIYDAGDQSYVSITIDGASASGHDRASAGDYSARVADGVVQLYDYAEDAWFAYDVQDPDKARSFHR
ncbi:MAG: hypothetical protein AAF291_01430 [Pseudomonadota bacterium]